MPAAARDRGAHLPGARAPSRPLLVADPDALAPAHDLLAAELAAIDAACSRFRPDSELWRVNRARRPPGPGQPAVRGGAGRRPGRGPAHRRGRGPHLRAALARLGYDRDFAAGPADAGPLRQPPVPAAAGAGSSSTRTGRRCRCPTGCCSTWAPPRRRWPRTGRRPPSRRPRAAASWSTWAGTSGWPGPAGRRLAGRRSPTTRASTPAPPASSPARWS